MEIPRHWRLKQQRYNLVGEECPHCETKIFPPRDVCPNCHSEAKIPYTFSGNGEIYSYTNSLALVKLDEGPLLTAGLTDFDHEPSIGERVEMVTRKLGVDGGEDTGIILYGAKFRPRV